MKVFRKTRETLLDNGKLGRYLAYAVGEVLLVMIGILLALQVNTWSANSNKEISRIESYQKIKLQLEEDIYVLKGIAGIIRGISINTNLRFQLLKNKTAAKWIRWPGLA